ncbi:hypothetical protein [Deinococcus apachensis]|uniref:hypothetical protein n=1 Tax=Deinococcus apachensis TaxID=309886 RepID=UPI0003673719|nr:hypothetical protein [Deinococcus apachensis]
MTDQDRHAAANAEQVRLLQEALAQTTAIQEERRPPPWVAVFACLMAGLGLGLNLLAYGGETEAFAPALFIAAVVLAGFTWAVWGR